MGAARGSLNWTIDLAYGADQHPPRSMIAARTDNDLDVLVERRQKPHQPLDREAIQPIVGERRNFGLRFAEDFTGIGLPQLARLDQGVDLESKLRLGLAVFGIRVAEIGKHVSGAAADLHAWTTRSNEQAFRPPRSDIPILVYLQAQIK